MRPVPIPTKWAINAQIILLAAAVVIGIGARGRAVFRAELFQDEAFTWRLTQKPLAEAILNTIDDGHAPLYTAVTWLTTHDLTDNIRILRLQTLLTGLGSIALAAILAWQLAEMAQSSEREKSRLDLFWAATAAAALVAVNELHAWNASTARMYSFGTLLALGATNAFVGSARQGWNVSRSLQYLVFSVAGVYTHHFIWFVILGHWLSCAMFLAARKWRFEPANRFEVGFGRLSFCVCCCYVPWLPVVIREAREVQAGYWIPAMSLQEWAQTITSAYTVDANSDTISFLLFALAAAAIIRLAYLKPAVAIAMIPAATLIIGVLIVNAVVFQRTLLQDRYLSFSSAHWLVLVGVSLTVHVGAFYRGLLVAPFLIAGVLSLAESIRIRADAVDSRELACEWVKDVDPAGQLILVLEPKDVNLVKYYLSKRKVSNLRVAWLRQIGMRRGHVIHVASFAEGDVLGHDELTDFDSIWCVRSDDGGVPFANFAVHRQRSFQGSWTAKCTAVELRRLK